jgi:hypothetical protein
VTVHQSSGREHFRVRLKYSHAVRPDWVILFVSLGAVYKVLKNRTKLNSRPHFDNPSSRYIFKKYKIYIFQKEVVWRKHLCSRAKFWAIFATLLERYSQDLMGPIRDQVLGEKNL